MAAPCCLQTFLNLSRDTPLSPWFLPVDLPCHPASQHAISRPSFKGEGSVAQLVEQGIENPCVGGSIPPRATS